MNFDKSLMGLDPEQSQLVEAFTEYCQLAAGACGGADLRPAASVLIAMVEAHFSREEALLSQLGYRLRLSHMREHLAVGHHLNTLLLGDCGIAPDEAAAIGHKVLVDHMACHDLAFKIWAMHAVVS